MLFFDQRPASRLDQLTVNENWNEPKTTDKDNKHHPIKLSREATQINHHFNCQVVGSKSMSLGEKNPFADQMPEDEIPAPIGYRYRRWSLGGDRELVVRCEVNGYEVRKGKREVFVSRALNEWDSKESGIIDYRLKLETQSGAVLSAENRCNSNKIARWAARALLSGAEQFKLGFVSRTNPKSNYAHQILLTQRFQVCISSHQHTRRRHERRRRRSARAHCHCKRGPHYPWGRDEHHTTLFYPRGLNDDVIRGCF